MKEKFIAAVFVLLILLLGACQNPNTTVTTNKGVCRAGEDCADYEDNGTVNETASNDAENKTSADETGQKTVNESKAETNKSDSKEDDIESKLVMFHNGQGPMCLEQIDFLEKADKCKELLIEKHLTSEKRELMNDMISEYDNSRGVSEDFSFLPITFVNGHAYSGFNEEVKKAIQEDIMDICD